MRPLTDDAVPAPAADTRAAHTHAARSRRLGLVGGCTALVLAETAIVSVLGPVTGLALAPQASAPTPFDLFHDLRWLVVYTPSWGAVLFGVVALLSVRVVLTAEIVGLAWPEHRSRPDRLTRLRQACIGSAIVAVLLIPWVVLTFATAVFSLSWTWIVAIPVIVMVSTIVHLAVVTPDWWRIRPPLHAVTAVLVAFASTTVLGAAAASGPAWVRWPCAVAAGAVNAWCWTRVVGAVLRAPSESSRPFAFYALCGVFALVIGGAALGFSVAVALERTRAPAPRAASLTESDGPPVLVVKGFNSRWDGIERQWVRGDFRIQRYSYAGLDRAGRPRPYDRQATHASLRVLARRMATQVDAIASATGARVGIVAESEGALIARAYLLGARDAPIASVVVLSPLVDPGRVSYPAPGRVGWGVAAGTLLDGVSAIVRGLGPIDVRSDTPLFRSMVEQAPLLQGLLQCSVRGVRELAIMPLDTGLAAPAPATVTIPSVVRPAVHGGLLGDSRTTRLVAQVLRGRPADTSTRWNAAADVVQALASPWQVPSLTKSLEPAWRDLPDPDDCRAVRRALHTYLFVR